jgi:hypothetical protein
MVVLMRRRRLDVDTADRMLDGRVPPMDAPPGYGAVSAFLLELRDAADGQHTTWATAGGQIPVTQRRAAGMLVTAGSGIRRSALVGALAFAAMTGTAFATGLPGAASDTAAAMLEKFHLAVPGPDEHAGDHPAGKTTDAATADDQATSAVNGTVAASQRARHHAGTRRQAPKPAAAAHDRGQGKDRGQGSTISTLARTTTATGVDKGAVISTAASGGQSQAGDHGQAGDSGTTTGGRGKAAEHSNAGEHSKANDRVARP